MRTLLSLLALYPSLTFAGPTISGGGNADEAPTTPYLVQSALDEAKEHYLPHFFASLETSYVTTKLYFARHHMFPGDNELGKLLEIGAKLFPSSGRDTFQLLAPKQINWDVRKDKPCYDADGVEMDGSATLPNTVCISIWRLTEGPNKLNKSDYVRRTVALAAHEVSHLLGTDEAQAKWVQDSANYAGLDSTEHGRNYAYWKLVDGLNATLDGLLANAESFDNTCAALRAIAPNAPTADDIFQNWAPARAEAKLRLNAVAIELNLLLPAITCNQGANAAEKPYFGGQPDTSLAQFLAILFKNSIGPVEPIVTDDERINWIGYGDAAALKAELQRLKADMARVQAIRTL